MSSRLPGNELKNRRLDALHAWSLFVEQGDRSSEVVRPEILRSWELSQQSVAPGVLEAPLADESETRSIWSGSPLQIAVASVEEELRRTAQDGDLVVAVTDPDTRVLWTYAGRMMRRRAETVNFVPGGRWDEASMGTNALGLAMREGRPSMVFSTEHFAPVIQNWVCWAAPLHDPSTGRQIGVLDISTSWERTHPIGLATARVIARMIEGAMPHSSVYAEPEPEPGEAGLSLALLGRAEAHLDGQRLLLNRRQTEILALLALHPDGLSAERLHSLVYGDQAVTMSTLKAEVSHLRSALHGQLASRPYRLTMPITVDVDTVLDALRAGDVSSAMAAYGGDLMPGTNSPALAQLAEYVAVAMREAMMANPDPTTVLRYAELAPHDTEVIEVCLARLGNCASHPAAPLLKGRLAAAERD